MELLSPRERRRSAFAPALLVLVLVLVGCIGTSPEDKARQDLGPDPGSYRNGPNHRAGFACTVCHGVSASPGFPLAGTIYADPAGKNGVAGATITVRDAKGREVTATSNQVGNFFFVLGQGTGRGNNQGESQLTTALVYPLSVRVGAGGQEQRMRGLIWREQSCAACHHGQASANSDGVVFAGSAP
jgi:hypothetical protein